jgi:uncharacterized coiled-coil protein SlyX
MKMKFVGKIEICEMPEEEVAGRAKIKMTGLKISKDDLDNNENGINWVKQYVKANIKSAIGASYKATFIDDDKTYPSGHGSMAYDEEGNVSFPDSDSVGSIQDAYIENLVIDGENCDVLTTEGFIYKQSYPNFYKWLKEQKEDGEIFGSIEINGKGDSKKIEYDGKSVNEDGTPFIGRKPKVFDIVSIAILSDFVPPADKFSRVLEINSKGEEMKNKTDKTKVKTTQTIEMNELSYDDIGCLITRAFNIIMSENDHSNGRYNCDSYYWIWKLYPETQRVIMNTYSNPLTKYYLTTYKIENNKVVLGDITEVEEDWKPVDNEQEAEINSALIKNIITNKYNKEVNNKMDDKVILELNQKIEDKTTEINQLTASNKELTDKNAEMNEVVVNANKSIEEANAKVEALTEELNACKTELEELKAEKEAIKAEAEKNQKIADTKDYFDTEIPKNGFTETEVNSLQSYVDNGDLEGLKSAESELCTKKIKELNAKKEKEDADTEINSASKTFITLHEKEKKVINDNATVGFFN